MSAFRDDVRPSSAGGEVAMVDEVDYAWFVYDVRQAVARDMTIIDSSGMNGALPHALYSEAVADGRLVHVAEVIDGHRQVPFFRVTDKGRAWLAEVDS